MPTEPKPAKVPVASSGDGTSEPSPTQLLATEGVDISVSSIALDSGLLAGRGGVPPTQAVAGLSPDGLSDAEVLLRVKAGDDAAFDYLLQNYRRPMHNFMYRMARNPAVAEELAQDVFLELHRHLARMESEAHMRNWLRAVASRRCIDRSRRGNWRRCWSTGEGNGGRGLRPRRRRSVSCWTITTTYGCRFPHPEMVHLFSDDSAGNPSGPLLADA